MEQQPTPSRSAADAILHLLDPAETDRGMRAVELLKTPPAYGCLDPEQRQFLTARCKELLESPRILEKNWHLGVFLASLTQHYGDPEAGSEMMLYVIARTQDRVLRDQLRYGLEVFCFTHNIRLGFELMDLFFQRYDDWFGHDDYPRLDFAPQENRAILLTGQMLRPPHQPTVDVLAMADILQNRFGYETAILNTNEQPQTCDLPTFDRLMSQRNPDFHGLQKIVAPPHYIFSSTADMPSRPGFLELFAFVQYWRPAFILNFGGHHISAEYLGRFANVITMPAGTSFVPTRTARHLVTFHPMSDAEKETVARYGMEPVHRIEATYNFSPPAIKPIYSRADFDLAETDFAVTMVGMRLGMEMTDDTQDMIRRVLELDPRIVVLLVGNVDDACRRKLMQRLPGNRIRIPGFVNDIPSFYAAVADLSLNPRRIGGGASAAYALAAGVPAFTLAGGHVADITHPDFVFANMTELLAAIVAALAEGNREMLRRKALSGFRRISSRERMLRDILTGAGLPTDLPPPAPLRTITRPERRAL